MPTLTDTQRDAQIQGPTEEPLATAWRLAVQKFELAEARGPAARADWRRVIAEYERIAAKQTGSLGAFVRERCAEQPGGT